MKESAEEFVNKWFLKGKIDNKHEFRTELNQLLKNAVEEAMYTGNDAELNDPGNYRIAINERNQAHFVILKSLVAKVPEHWSIIQPNRGTLSKNYYTSEGNILPELMRKHKVIRSAAEIKLNS